MANCLERDEFIVDPENVDLIKNFKDKIERSFEIRIQFDEVAEVDENKTLKQWISVEGGIVDRKNAREYIIALCQPDSTQQFLLENKNDVDMETIEQIEKQTNAVLWKVDEKTIEIRGSEFAVILAMTSLESHVNKSGNDTETDGVTHLLSAPKLNVDLSSSVWSKELDSRLVRALSSQSELGENSVSIDDYSKTSPSVKMTILKCMNDFDDEDLFPSSEDHQSSYRVPVFLEGEQINRNLFPTDNEEKVGNSDKSEQKMEGDGVKQTSGQSSNVGNLASKLTETNIAASGATKRKSVEQKDIDYLRSFGISVGYDEDEVEEGLQYVDSKTKPADFLEMLNKIKENKELLQKKAAMETSDDNNKTFPPPPSAPKADGSGSFGRRSLPESYKQRLMIDFSEEDEHLSVEELKKRNAERQEMLKNAFESEKEAENAAAGMSPRVLHSANKKKRRRKRNRKKKQSENEQENQQNQESKTETTGARKASSSDDVIMISSDDDENGDGEDDETCVLQLWEPAGTKSDVTDSPKAGPNTNPTGHMPVYTQQKPRANAPNRNQQYNNYGKPRPRQPYQQGPTNPWTGQYIPGGQGLLPTPQRANYPRYPRPLIPNLPQGPVRYQHPPRPYYNPRDNMAQQQQQNVCPNPRRNVQSELRYIVIDGSNVAMCHGNGKFFSCKGIKIVIDYFLKRGHKQVTAFVPEWRKYNPRPENPIKDQDLLIDLKEKGHLVFTPSRRINGRLITSYDDRYVLALAETEEGIIVSNDQYRDLMREKASWRKIIEERLLLFSFVGDNFMPPEDPLGRDGPVLDVFLCKPPSRKRMASPPQMGWDGQFNPQAQRDNAYNNRFNNYNNQFNNNQNFPPLNDVPDSANNQIYTKNDFPGAGRGRGGQGQSSPMRQKHKDRPARTPEKTKELVDQLKGIFPENEAKIHEILQNHPSETDMTKLTNYLMNVMFQ